MFQRENLREKKNNSVLCFRLLMDDEGLPLRRLSHPLDHTTQESNIKAVMPARVTVIVRVMFCCSRTDKVANLNNLLLS